MRNSNQIKDLRPIFLGTSNTLKAKKIISNIYPDSVVTAIGDASIEIIPALLNIGTAKNASQAANLLVIDSFPNDMCLYADGFLNFQQIKSSAESIGRLIEEADQGWKVFILNLVPAALTSRFKYHEIDKFSSERNNILKESLPCEIMHWQFTCDKANDNDIFHFTDDTYEFIYTDLLSKSEIIKPVDELRLLPEVIKAINVEPSSRNILEILGVSAIGYLRTYSNSAISTSYLELKPGVHLSICAKRWEEMPSALLIVSSTIEQYMIFQSKKNTHHILSSVVSIKGIVRYINIEKIINSCRKNGEPPELRVTISDQIPADSIEVPHINSGIAKQVVDPSNCGILEFCWNNTAFSLDTAFTINDYTEENISNLAQISSKKDLLIVGDTAIAPKILQRKSLTSKTIFYDSFWPDFRYHDNCIFTTFANIASLELAQDLETADVIITSVFCNDYDLQGNFEKLRDKSSAPIVFYTGEHSNVGLPGIKQIDLSRYDAAISHYFVNNPRHAWVPLYIGWWGWNVYEKANFEFKANASNHDKIRKAFYCYSNPNAVYRAKVAKGLLSKDLLFSCGSHLNNNNGENASTNMNQLMSQYNLSLAFENASYPGYFTEKCVRALMAGSRVIYWGDPDSQWMYNTNICTNVTGMPEEWAISFIENEIMINHNLAGEIPFPNPISLANASYSQLHDVASYIRSQL